jgi:hypothetical protein
MSGYHNELRSCLEREFCADVFEEAYGLAWRAARQDDRPLGFFTLWSIFRYLDSWWRDRPLTEDTAKRMEEALRSPVIDYLVAADATVSPEVETEYLNRLVRSYQDWVAIQRDIPRGQ